ncbi:MAG: GNAT family N-acetyltransferase [Lachnospiraceae bacterium]|nr:GNAT family N-acetyltransferase [Lachnospiraceae bacterium]
MKIVRINQDQKDYFAALDPLDVMDKEYISDGFMLGAVNDDDKEDIPSGLVICTIDEEAVMIRWIYVAQRFRGQGYGDELLSAVFKAARNAGKRCVRAFLPDEYGREYICNGDEEFFKLNGFTKDIVYDTGRGEFLIAEVPDIEEEGEGLEELEGIEGYSIMDVSTDTLPDRFPERELTKEDLVLKISDIAGSVLMDGAKENKAVSLSELTIPVLGRGLNRLLKEHPYDVYGDGDLLSVSPDSFDLYLSSGYMEKGEITGLFLLHPGEKGIIWADYLFDKSANPGPQLLAMLDRSAKELVSKYPKKTEVAVRVKRPETRHLLKQLFPDKKVTLS